MRAAIIQLVLAVISAALFIADEPASAAVFLTGAFVVWALRPKKED